jgi:thioredoxin-dependent peroxiredoxin
MTILKPGQPAPLFHLIDQRSHLVDLEQALEKGPILLLFYRRDFEPKTASILRQWKHWLEKNTLEANNLEANNQNHNLQVFAISSDEWERHHQFANQLALPFAVLYDHLGKVAKRYGCQIIPVIWSRDASFLINKDAQILQSCSGLITPADLDKFNPVARFESTYSAIRSEPG